MSSTTLTFDALLPDASSRTGATAGLLAQGAEFLTFRLGGHACGLDIRRVQDVRAFTPPAHSDGVRPGVIGALHLGGITVPVLDLRRLVGLPDRRHDADNVTLVLSVAHRVVAMVVDGVSDVVAVTPHQLCPATHLPAGWQRHHVLGLGMLAERELLLIDLDALFADPALGLISP